ncbi:hypothetical protein SEA_MINIFLAYER_20 [Satellite phage MiniFlayer]|nr:hypothetical protein SEA_MINIFLAYER_20 [Satellite phage MiniFlayer]
MRQTPRGLDTLEEAIEDELWERLRKWDILVDVDSYTVEKVLRRMANKAKHWRDER